jgi:hypothetical protein
MILHPPNKRGRGKCTGLIALACSHWLARTGLLALAAIIRDDLVSQNRCTVVGFGNLNRCLGLKTQPKSFEIM